MEYCYNLDFQKIRKITQVDDIPSLEFYLRNIFNDLVSRENNNREEKSIEKITFIEYMNIPYIVGEKIFKVFNKNKDGFMNQKEFITGIINLYSGSLEETEEMIFNLLDFDLDGIIIPEDARLLITFIKNLARTSTKEIDLKIINDKTFTDEEELKSIDNFVNSFFKGKQNLTFDEFKAYIERENSDLFFLFMYFLYNNKPFQNYSIKFLKLRNNKNDFNNSRVIDIHNISTEKDKDKDNNIKKKLISPSKSFKDIIEEITYIDMDELSNCSDLENLEDLDDLTFSTMENVRIDSVPKLNANIKLFKKKNESDYIKCSTKNLQIFGSRVIKKSEEYFKERLLKNNSFNLDPQKEDNFNSKNNSLRSKNSLIDNVDSNKILVKKKSNYLNKEYSYKNTYTEMKICSSDESREESKMNENNNNMSNSKCNSNSTILKNNSQQSDINLRLGEQFKKETKVLRCTTDLKLISNNNEKLPKIEIYKDKGKTFNEMKNNVKELVNKKNLNFTNIHSNKVMNKINHISSSPRSLKNIKDDDCIEFESYLFRAEENNQLKKYFTALIGCDLYYFSNSKKVRLKGLHNLSGTYIFKDPNPIKVRKEKPIKISK
jgi:hypothetical protein